MRILTSIFGGSGLEAVKARSRRWDQEMPMSELYSLLWKYYLSNGVYDDLRSAGYYLSDHKLKEIYNPCTRSVEFFVDTIWPGTLPNAIPLINVKDNVREAIEQVWDWSNWQTRKQVAVRWGSITGNVFLRVARPLPKKEGEEAPQRVYIQLVRPEYVTAKETDERDYITYCRLDFPQERREGREMVPYTHTEEWTPELLRIWWHDSPQKEIDQLGEPVYEVELKAWGLDFIPIVHAQHIDIGEDEGVGTYTLYLSKINELNRVATRLHQILYRHNDVTWALQSNMMDPSGRPIPAPRIRSSSDPGSGSELDSVELGGEKMVRLPGQASLAPLIPSLNYGSHLDTVLAQLEEIERDLPQLMYYRLKDLPELSGKALRLLLTPAVSKASEARGNLEAALIRAHKMALTIGSEIGAFSGLGTYEAGDFDHEIAERPLIAYSRLEVAELATAETGAGIPLVTSLRESGWDEEKLAQMKEDKEEESSAQTAGLASALLAAQDQFGAQGSTGLENPTPPAPEGPETAPEGPPGDLTE